jgi:hypothetical protein
MPFGPECDWSRGHGQFTCLSPVLNGVSSFLWNFLVQGFTLHKLASGESGNLLVSLIHFILSFLPLAIRTLSCWETRAFSPQFLDGEQLSQGILEHSGSCIFFCHVIRRPILKFKTRKFGNLAETSNNVSENMMVL